MTLYRFLSLVLLFIQALLCTFSKAVSYLHYSITMHCLMDLYLYFSLHYIFLFFPVWIHLVIFSLCDLFVTLPWLFCRSCVGSLTTYVRERFGFSGFMHQNLLLTIFCMLSWHLWAFTFLLCEYNIFIFSEIVTPMNKVDNIYLLHSVHSNGIGSCGRPCVSYILCLV